MSMSSYLEPNSFVNDKLPDVAQARIKGVRSSPVSSEPRFTNLLQGFDGFVFPSHVSLFLKLRRTNSRLAKKFDYSFQHQHEL